VVVRLAWLYFLAWQGRGLRESVGQENGKTGPVLLNAAAELRAGSTKKRVCGGFSLANGLASIFCLQKTSRHIDCVMKTPFSSNLK
jgi:hypothetical protein